MTTEINLDYWEVSSGRLSQKRLSPSAPKINGESLDISGGDFCNHKRPKVSHDAESGFISGLVSIERYKDTFQSATLLPHKVASTASGSSPVDSQIIEDETSLDEEAKSNLSDKEANDVCCFGTVVEENPILKLDSIGDLVDCRVEVSLKIASQYVSVHDHESMAYAGLLHRNLARPLIDIDKENGIKFTAFVTIIQGGKSQASLKRSEKLQINIHGPKEKGQLVCDVLDEAGIYLQHPQACDLSVPYFNPNYLIRPGGKHPEPISELKLTNDFRTSLSLKSDERLKSNILQAIDLSVQGQETSHYLQICQSPWIRTPLKPHQLAAISLMVGKESGRIEGGDFESLWQRVAHRDGSERYKNAITGYVQSAQPTLCLGGLLADAMGLGKTLTMLAVIVNSLEHPSKVSGDFPTNVSAKQTLIIAPLSLLFSWSEQIERHVETSKVKYCIYHGASRSMSAADFTKFDVVLTTYDTLISGITENRKGRLTKTQPLEEFEWHRIVLDEAHVIRNALSQRHRALLKLKARYRWCLTGTPIFNNVQDLYALLKFLKVHPFDSLSYFNTHITKPLKSDEDKGLENLKRLFRCVALRRTKEAVKDQLDLPPRHAKFHIVEFSPGERATYDVLRRSLLFLFHTLEVEPDKYGQNGNVLQTITRLRRFCDHNMDLLPEEVRSLVETSGDHEKIARLLMSGLKICDICGMQIPNPDSATNKLRTSQCGHDFCDTCLLGPSNIAQPCALCFGLEASRTPSSVLEYEPMENELSIYRPSSKVQAMLKNLSLERSADPQAKCVIFSCWTKMLDLVGIALRQQGLKYQRIDGQQSEKPRRHALEDFRSNAQCGILLASIGSAGVGLDLTAASYVHLLEPQWSPMAEEQAFDRVHRMGQVRPVTITRYYVKDSIEEHVVLVQRNKYKTIAHSMDLENDDDQISLKGCLAKDQHG